MDGSDLLGRAILTESKEDVQRLVGEPGFRRQTLDQLLKSGNHNPLTLATSRGNLDIVKILLDAGADPLSRAAGGSAIHVAARCGRSAIAAELLKRGVHVSVESWDQCRPLFIAAQHGSVKTLQVFVEAGADIECRHEGYYTALFMAAQSGQTGAALELIKNGAYTGPQGRHGWTPLMQSSHRGYLEITKALLQHRCPPNTRNEQGATALHLAASTNQSAVVELLLDYGADREASSPDVETPLHWAIQEKHVQAIFVLTRYWPPSIQQPPLCLHLCILGHDFRSALDLLEGGTSPGPKNADGLTPLHRAVLNSSPKGVEVMLRGGADESAALPPAHAKGKDDVTPLALSLKRLSRRRQQCADARVAKDRVRVRDALLRAGAFRGGSWRWPEMGTETNMETTVGGNVGYRSTAAGEVRNGVTSGSSKAPGKVGATPDGCDRAAAFSGKDNVPDVALVRHRQRDGRRVVPMTVKAIGRYASKALCEQDLEG